MAVYRKKTVTIEVYERVEDENTNINEIHLIVGNKSEIDSNGIAVATAIGGEDKIEISKQEYFDFIFNKYKEHDISYFQHLFTDEELEEFLRIYYNEFTYKDGLLYEVKEEYK